MRLINADYVEKLLSEKAESTTCELAKQTLNTFVLIIKSIPTIEAEPVKHGEWLTNFDEQEGYCERVCSNCGGAPYYESNIKKEYKFCPYCGVKMDL